MKKIITLLLAGIMVFSLAACSSGGGNAETTAAPEATDGGSAETTAAPEATDGGSAETTAASDTTGSAQLPEYTVILDYVPNTNHTGMYVAMNKGFYEEEGFTVNIIEPTDLDSNTVVATGSADFGVTYQEDLTLALAGTDPLPVKAIATLIQHNTSGFVCLKGSGYDDPAKWEGITYAGWGGSGEEAVLNAVMIQAGKDPEKLNRVIADGLGYESLGRACDLMWFFEAWDCIQAEMGGVELDYVPCRELDERLDYYTPILTTSQDMISNNPDLVKAFLRATEKGYKYAIENPDEAAEILSSYVPDYDIEMLKKSQAYLTDKYMEDTSNWGEMKDEVWDNYTDFMLEYGVLEKDVPASQCYTNEFLPFNN